MRFYSLVTNILLNIFFCYGVFFFHTALEMTWGCANDRILVHHNLIQKKICNYNNFHKIVICSHNYIWIVNVATGTCFCTEIFYKRRDCIGPSQDSGWESGLPVLWYVIWFHLTFIYSYFLSLWSDHHRGQWLRWECFIFKMF